MNHYETVFISTPVLSDVQIKEAVKKYHDFIVDNGGEIVHEEDWGLKKLAYPIQKKTTGFYHLIEFKADPAFIAKLEIQYRRDERIIRFLTFALDKHAIAYAERRRANKSESKN
ncbi:MAG: 30S ribosomal protein S6 [Bacteroidetes bacterium 41-46]|jgi:small subunit ribosomal protein S6|nr:MAG: 30S ribosomal protein S6 [Bacteroidetes bacterium 41-46]